MRTSGETRGALAVIRLNGEQIGGLEDWTLTCARKGGDAEVLAQAGGWWLFEKLQPATIVDVEFLMLQGGRLVPVQKRRATVRVPQNAPLDTRHRVPIEVVLCE